MLDKNKTYLVLNYNGSPVAVSTRHESYTIAGGSLTEPASIPLSVDEIIQINSNSPVFKIGLLWFEEEYQKDLYEECRIRNWEEILSDSSIEDIILHPTLAKLQKLLLIENEQYFERCYGVYIGLKNSNHSIQQNVENLMLVRRKELRNRKYKTSIELSKKDSNILDEEAFKEAQEQNKKLAEEVDQLKAMIAQLLNSNKDLSSKQDEKVASKMNNETAVATDNIKQEPQKVGRGRPRKKS